MRITFVLPFVNISGGIKVIATYAERLKKRGHEVFVVSIPKRPIKFKERIKFFIKNRRFPTESHAASFFSDMAIKHKVIESYRPICNDDIPDADIVIATWWETAEWVNSFEKSKGSKIYFIQGHEILDFTPIERVKKTYSMPFKKIAVSKWLINILEKEYGDYNVSLVPNSVDFNVFNSPERHRQIYPKIGFMYSIPNIKGCDLIINSLNRIHEVFPDLRIVSFGTKKPIPELPLPSSTEFYHQPHQDIIRNIYSSCDIWLFGSRAEGFGLPILEAMACRTPVIATPTGAAPELLCNGGGILLNDFTVDSMVDAILKIYKLPESGWKDISDKAYKTSRNYSLDEATTLFENCLHRNIYSKQ